MKTLYFLLIMLLPVSYSCSSKNVTSDDPKWTIIQYYFQTGTVPPPYYYSYSILINTDKKVILKYIAGYLQDDTNTFNYELTLTNDQLKTLNDEIEKSEVIEGDIKSLPQDRTPVGGSNNSLRITFVNPNPNLDQPPRIKDITPFPEKQWVEKLDNLYKYIKELVPKANWDDAAKRRDEYMEKHKR